MRRGLNAFKLVISSLLAAAALHIAAPGKVVAQVCAKVRIEIVQELAFERQAFEAEMVINNTLDTQTLEQVRVDVKFEDEDGNPVLATSDPNNTSALFFIRTDSLENIQNVSGTGRVAPSTSARIRWLIIPSPNASGGSLAGKRYGIGAHLSYRLGGELQEVDVIPDFVTVKPQPLLELDYFITQEIRANDPDTPNVIEPSEPFTLGVRILNTGFGSARNVSIQSAQPRIVENDLLTLIGFEIVGSYVNDEPATPTLLIDFGDIAGGRATVGRWVMTTSLSGRFTEFSARFTHSDELGGLVTSLLNRVGAHFLIRDVNVDLPGRDGIRDFLADDSGVVRVYESDGEDTLVTDIRSGLTLIPLGNAGGVSSYRLDLPPTAGFLYAKLPDPNGGSKEVVGVRRADGKSIKSDNAWMSAEGTGADTAHYFNLFDANGGGEYIVDLGTKVLGPVAPVIQFVPDRSVDAGSRVTFIVLATDQNGTIPSLSIDTRPLGATFVDRGNGEAQFDWPTTTGQAGRYPVTFRATDGKLSSARTAIITVSGIADTDGDGMDDAWEIAHFGNLERDGNGDNDSDGVTDRDEFEEGTDPTYAGTAVATPVIVSPLDQAHVTTTNITLRLQNIAHGVDKPTYQFELYADQPMTQLVATAAAVVEGQTETVFAVPTALNDNAWYYWRARASLTGFHSEWVYGSFFVNTANDAPGAFQHSSPPEAAEVTETSPILSVTNSVDPDGDIITYGFEVATDNAGATIVASASNIAQGSNGSTNWEVRPPLIEGRTYYWRGSATDTHNAVTRTGWRSFSVLQTNRAPTLPQLLSPINNADVASLNVTLTLRNSQDPDEDSLSYLFEVDTVPTFDSAQIRRSGAVPQNGSGNTSFTFNNLSDNTGYYWRARASDGTAVSDWAQDRFFVNSVNDLPTTPTIQNPGTGAVVPTLTPTLSVFPSTDLDNDPLSYRFQVFTDAFATKIVASAVVSQPSWTVSVTLDNGRQYFWRARAEDTRGGVSGWSQGGYFLTDENGVNDPPWILLTSPTESMTYTSGTVFIGWADVDPDSDATVRVFANDLLILPSRREDLDREGDVFAWPVSTAPAGVYRIRAEISDGTYSSSSSSNATIRILHPESADSDGDGTANTSDNCPYYPNADQKDTGRIVEFKADGIGDVCQCGDVNGDGVITEEDGNLIKAATKAGSSTSMPHPELCNVNTDDKCTGSDGDRVLSAVKTQRSYIADGSTKLVTTLKQNCLPALP